MSDLIKHMLKEHSAAEFQAMSDEQLRRVVHTLLAAVCGASELLQIQEIAIDNCVKRLDHLYVLHAEVVRETGRLVDILTADANRCEVLSNG